MNKQWEHKGGLGYQNTDHAFVYKYVGDKSMPVSKRWRLKVKRGSKKLDRLFKTQHQAIEHGVHVLFNPFFKNI